MQHYDISKKTVSGVPDTVFGSLILSLDLFKRGFDLFRGFSVFCKLCFFSRNYRFGSVCNESGVVKLFDKTQDLSVVLFQLGFKSCLFLRNVNDLGKRNEYGCRTCYYLYGSVACV